jgi:hypothetical protein
MHAERAFASLQEELHQLVRACQQLVVSGSLHQATEAASYSVQTAHYSSVNPAQQAQAGSWEVPSEGEANGAVAAAAAAGTQQRSFGQCQPPHWVWSGLAHLAPEATQVGPCSAQEQPHG